MGRSASSFSQRPRGRQGRPPMSWYSPDRRQLVRSSRTSTASAGGRPRPPRYLRMGRRSRAMRSETGHAQAPAVSYGWRARAKFKVRECGKRKAEEEFQEGARIHALCPVPLPFSLSLAVCGTTAPPGLSPPGPGVWPGRAEPIMLDGGRATASTKEPTMVQRAAVDLRSIRAWRSGARWSSDQADHAWVRPGSWDATAPALRVVRHVIADLARDGVRHPRRPARGCLALDLRPGPRHLARRRRPGDRPPGAVARAALLQCDSLPLRRTLSRARPRRPRRQPLLSARFCPRRGVQPRHPPGTDPDHHGRGVPL